MQETYTFSRALHLMRYGGKKMRLEFWDEQDWMTIKDNKFVFNFTDEDDNDCIGEDLVLGSWIEVKDD